MTIIGIDPGTKRMGYAIVKVQNNKPTEISTLGYIDLSDIKEHPEKLKTIYEELNLLLDKYHPDAMAIEAPFYGKNAQSMLKLGRAQGIAMSAAFSHKVSVAEYSPKKVKLSITGNGNASKEQVSAMLKNILPFEYTEKYLDATDAMAVAICHCFQINNSIKKTTVKTNTQASRKKNTWKNFIEKNPDRKM